MDELISLDRSEVERLVSVIDSSLRVNRRHQFYLWVQGVVQSLLPHEVLICGMGDLSAARFRVDCFAAIVIPDGHLKAICAPQGGLFQSLADAWLSRGRDPLLVESEGGPRDHLGSLREQMEGIGLGNIAVHGTSTVGGTVGSLFGFAQVPGRLSARHDYMLQVLVPFLHVAWMRTQLDVAPPRHSVPFASALLTPRESEILNWIREGKSNAEIGAILSISALTVKNHVQKILRKLKVQNRTEAVAKGMSLNIVQAQPALI